MNRIIVGVALEHGERQSLRSSSQDLGQPYLFARQQRRTPRPAGDDIGQHERLHGTPARDRTAVATRSATKTRAADPATPRRIRTGRCVGSPPMQPRDGAPALLHATDLCCRPPGCGKTHCGGARIRAGRERLPRTFCAPPSSCRSCSSLARPCSRSRHQQLDKLAADPSTTSPNPQIRPPDRVLVRADQRPNERRSMLITANQPFADWNKVFPDPAMTIAAVDRLSTIPSSSR